MLAAWLHTLSPFVYKNDWVPLRWYGVSYALGFLIGWWMLKFLCRRGACRIPVERVGDAVLLAVIGVVIGGRLGYVFFYEPVLLTDFSKDFPWWGVFKINHGGMSSHGGIIGVIIAAFLIARGFKNPTGERVGKAPVLHVLDTMVLIAAPGLGLGRLANFINGELLGKIVAMPGQPAPGWAVKFPQERLSAPMNLGGHCPELTPQQDAAMEAILAPFRVPGLGFEKTFERLLARLQAGDTALAKSIEPLISARHPSQLYQAFTDGIVLLLITWFIARKPRLPGMVGCGFLISYGIMRIVTEFYRLPDVGVPRTLGLSRGQWLSAAMIAAGFIALPIILARGGKKLGGWLSITADRSAPAR